MGPPEPAERKRDAICAEEDLAPGAVQREADEFVQESAATLATPFVHGARMGRISAAFWI